MQRRAKGRNESLPIEPTAQDRLELLRSMLAANFGRVVEVFHLWDEDGSGSVSRNEFKKALPPVLGMTIDRADSDALFDMFDADKSGSIDYTELHSKLRIGSDIELAKELRRGSGGVLEASENKTRGSELSGKGGLLAAVVANGDEDPIEALRTAISKSMMRVLDLFRVWDEDQSGTVSKKEFRRALPVLGFKDVSREVVDALFDSLDGDKSGTIEYRELQKLLRQRSEVPNFGQVHVNMGMRGIVLPKQVAPAPPSKPPPPRRPRPQRALRPRAEVEIDPQQFIDNMRKIDALIGKAENGESLTDAEFEQLANLGASEAVPGASESRTRAALAKQKGLKPQLQSARTAELAAKARLLQVDKELRDIKTERAARTMEAARQACAREIRSLADPAKTHDGSQSLSDLTGTVAASPAAVKWFSECVNQRLTELYNDPRGTWFKLFRSMDVNNSGDISFGELESLVRDEPISLSTVTITDQELRSMWCKISPRLNLMSCREFAQFMRLGENVFPQHQEDKAWRARVGAKAKKAASAVRAEKHFRLHRHIAKELDGEAPATTAAVADLSRRFNERMEELQGGDSSDEVHGAWFKLFRFMDADGSGLIDFREFKAMIRQELCLAPPDLPETEIKRLWLALDEDGSGHISGGEFGRFMRRGNVKGTGIRKEMIETQRREHAARMRQEELSLREKREERESLAAAKRREQVRATKALERRMALGAKTVPRRKETQVYDNDGVFEPRAPQSARQRAPAFKGAIAATPVEQLELSILLNSRFNLVQEDLGCRSWYALFRRGDVDDLGSLSFPALTRMFRRHLELQPALVSDAALRSLWVVLDSSQMGFISWPVFGLFTRLGEQGPQGVAQRLIRKLELGHVLTDIEMAELRKSSEAAVPCASKGAEAKARRETTAKVAAAAMRDEKNKRVHRNIKDELSEVGSADVATVTKLSRQFNEQMKRVAENDMEPLTWYGLYQRMDTDSSGLISYAEFSQMARDTLGLPQGFIDDRALKRVWLACDTDESGNISVGEFHSFMKLGEPAKESPKAIFEKRRELAHAARADVEVAKVNHTKQETVKAAERAKDFMEQAKVLEAQLEAAKRGEDIGFDAGGSRSRTAVHAAVKQPRSRRSRVG